MRAVITKSSIRNIRHIIAVASGKGGVGKSTTSVNLAAALADKETPLGGKLRVGLLDADIYGPSIPLLMGLTGLRPAPNAEKLFVPLQAHGISCMSMGFLLEEGAPVVWRGLMVMSAVRQLLFQVQWGELDVLVIDMPPGTGDTQLTITQELGERLDGALIVSTPQDIALIDARRGANMFSKVNVPILGMIQNMSCFECPKCHQVTHIFGKDGVADTAKKMDIPLLGEIPLEISVRVQSDEGTPIVFSDPTSSIATSYRVIADKIWNSLETKRVH